MVRGKFGRAAPCAGEIQTGRPRAREEHSIPQHTPGCHAMRGVMSAWSNATTAARCFPTAAAIGSGENPQRLYTVVFDGAELWGRDARPDIKDIHRRVRAISGGGIWMPPRRAINGRPPRHTPRRRWAGVSRTLGGASLCDGARPAVRGVCSPGTNGPQRLPMKSNARRRAGDPDTGETYYRHWLATLERLVAAKGVATLPRPCTAIAMPGTTPLTARRTARRSNCGRRILAN